MGYLWPEGIFCTNSGSDSGVWGKTKPDMVANIQKTISATSVTTLTSKRRHEQYGSTKPNLSPVRITSARAQNMFSGSYAEGQLWRSSR